MVSLVPPIENGAFGTGRQSGRSDGQNPSDRRQLAEAEKTQPASTAGGVSVRLSEAARGPFGDAQTIRGASGNEKPRETLSGAAADLDTKAGASGSVAEALHAKRAALTLALVSGASGEVATAARELAEAKAASEEESTGFPLRASFLVEESTVAYDPETSRFVPSTRRVALSVEREFGERVVDPRQIGPGEKGVSIIHADPAVPTRPRPGTSAPASGSGAEGVAPSGPHTGLTGRS